MGWLRKGETEVKTKKKKKDEEEKAKVKQYTNKNEPSDRWMDFHSFISHVPAALLSVGAAMA